MSKNLDDLKNRIEEFSGRHHWVQEGIDLIPVLGDAQSYILGISNLNNSIKLEYAWYCIAKDTNIEKSINELYDYVSDTDRAFYITGEFRKIVLSSSLIASSIIAYIMGRVVHEHRKCEHKEIIITNALTHMTDYDLNNFIYLCRSCIKEIGEYKTIDLSQISNNQKYSFQYTIQVCVANGLINTESFISDEDSVYGGLYYVKTDMCDELLKYIEIIKQLLRYNID